MAHMHYKGTGNVHSFRGILTDVDGSNQDEISIQGSVGAVAWRIIKFEIMAENPGTTDYEHIVKIYRENQSSVTGDINFTEGELLAAGFTEGGAATNFIGNPMTIIYDHVLFVRNIHVTHVDTKGALNCNYYIELEEVKVSAAGMAQLGVAAARRRQVDA
jgi:hypothetical protein